MPRFRPLGEELLSPGAAPRGSQAASGCRADGVSQGRARGAPRHGAGEAHSLRPELGFARGGGRGGDLGRGWGSGRGGGKGSERRRGRRRDARGSYPEVSGYDWRLTAARGVGPGGFGTGSPGEGGGERGGEGKRRRRKEAGRLADRRAGGCAAQRGSLGTARLGSR